MLQSLLPKTDCECRFKVLRDLQGEATGTKLIVQRGDRENNLARQDSSVTQRKDYSILP